MTAIYPDLRRMAITAFGAADVLRFLGRNLHGNFQGDVSLALRHRPEGWRVKYWMKRNSLKIYDKASVLRVATTINKHSSWPASSVGFRDFRPGAARPARAGSRLNPRARPVRGGAPPGSWRRDDP